MTDDWLLVSIVRTLRFALLSFVVAGTVTAGADGADRVLAGRARSFAPTAAQVMIVGVAHLVSRRDVHNSSFTDSPLSSKRQLQIADVVRRLGRFRPTKVFVELPSGKPVFAERYRRYSRGTYALPAAEPYQYGFRLARLVGNDTIFPIDTFGPPFLNDTSRSDGFVRATVGRVRVPRVRELEARGDALEHRGTYLALLRYLNTDGAIRANASFYSVFDAMGRDADDAGASYVSQWYARNCYIFSNLSSVLVPGDRAVVIFGQGHEYLLREFVRLNPNLRDVDPLRYLDK